MSEVGLWSDGVLVGDRYRIEAYLDQGAAGEVYAARNVWTDRPVAIKRLQPKHLEDATTVERFLLEGRIGGRIEHPNVVQTLDMGREGSDGSLFIVQELLRGCGMRDVLEQGRKRSVFEALDLMLPIMGAVYAVHQHGIVHRDIKPENIFIADGVLGHRTPKLLDFGIAKVRLHETLTQRGTVLGTLDYMAPEQLLGEKEIDRRADVWAVAVVFFELLAGATPFESSSVGVTIHRILTQEPSSVRELNSEVDEELAQLLDSALRKDRHARPGSMQEMLEALLRWVNGPGRAMERRLVARHRASIPAMLEAKLGHESNPQSAPDPLRATFRGLTVDSGGTDATPPLSFTRYAPVDLAVSQMIPIVIGDDVPESDLETAPKEATLRSADASGGDDGDPSVEVSSGGIPALSDFEEEIEDPTETFTFVGGLAVPDESGEAGVPDFDLERVVRAATGEMPRSRLDETLVPADEAASAPSDHAEGESTDRSPPNMEGDAKMQLDAARLALSHHGLERAVALAECVFEEAEQEGWRIEARLIQAEAAWWSGDFRTMDCCCADAYLLAEPGSPYWLRAVGQIASASGVLGTHERLRDLASVLRETPVDASRIPEMVMVSCRLGIVMHRAGWPEHVEALLSRLTNDLFDEADGEAAGRAWVLSLRGELARSCDRMMSLGLFSKAVEAFIEAGDMRSACAQRIEVANAHLLLGDLEAASLELRETLRAAAEMNLYTATAVRARLADTYERNGDIAEAKELALTALTRAKPANDWHTTTVALLVLSNVACAEGDGSAAELHARTAVGCAAPSAAMQANALAVLASVLHDRPLESLMAAVQAVEVLQALRDSVEGEARIRLAHVAALEALEHTESARQALAQAQDRILSQASGISDDKRREQFLRGVREHRVTLERAKAYGISAES